MQNQDLALSAEEFFNIPSAAKSTATAPQTWIKVEDGCYQWGKYSVEYDYEASERDKMQWNVYLLGSLLSTHSTLRNGKAMVRVHDERGYC